MLNLSTFCEYWLDWIVAASWQLSLLVCVIALISVVARKASARFRHGLWLLVLLKMFLPTGLATPLSIGDWCIGPIVHSIGNIQIVSTRQTAESPTLNHPVEGKEDIRGELTQTAFASSEPLIPIAGNSLAANSFLVWCTGCLLFWFAVLGRFAHLSRVIRRAEVIDEGPLCIAVEKFALALGLRRVPEIVIADLATSPFLIGVFRPVIVLPKGFLTEYTECQQQAVLIHEMVHWHRYDTWIGWTQVIAQSAFWFHPFAWWANAQLRHERECACDEVVLRLGNVSPQDYGDSIIRVLIVSRGRSLAAASLVGVFERGPNLQFRLEEIMNYERSKFQYRWLPSIVLAICGILFVPMAYSLNDLQLSQAEDSQKDSPKVSYPIIIETVPKVGATQVDSTLKGIRVTFDCDMERGMSWTGGPPLFPPLDDKRKAKWIDKRTCILPVELDEGSYYRLGINSTSYQNFRSEKGIPARPSAIYFTTRGTVDRRVRAPEVQKTEPANGSKDVAPSTRELKVTFDISMDEGMSWCGADELLDDSDDDRKAHWSTDSRTCTLPVKLEPDHEYVISLNSLDHINFQSRWGVPLAPVIYKFKTSKSTE